MLEVAIKYFLQMISLFFCFLSLLAAQVANATGETNWRHDLPCGSRIPIQDVEVSGCARAVSAQLPNGVKFLACEPKLPDNPYMAADINLRLSRGDKIIYKWKSSLDMESVLDGDQVRVDAIDLNGDGKKEILFAFYFGTTNGVAIDNWRIWAFDGTHLSKPIDVQNYGYSSRLVCSQDRRYKFLIYGRWWIDAEWMGKEEPRILIGYWLSLDHNGEFCLSPDRPLVYRLSDVTSFDDETLKKPWFWSPQAHPILDHKTVRQVKRESPVPACTRTPQ